jgi:hypothetical protein
MTATTILRIILRAFRAHLLYNPFAVRIEIIGEQL